MLDYSPLKLIKGSANTNPQEDPVLGTNGTMAVIRINNFIQRVQDDLTTMVPQGKGNLIVGGSTDPMELQVGPNNYCLTVDPTSPSGLLWEERVDLTTAQQVGGKKTFSSDLSALQDMSVGLDLEVGGNTSIVGNLSAHNIQATGTLEVGLATLLHSTLTVTNNTNLQSNLAVGGASSLNTAVVSSTLNVGGDTHIGSDLTVVGTTTLQSNLTLEGTAQVTGSIMVGNDVLVEDSLSIKGAANIASLVVTGPTALGNTTATNLSVTGTTNLSTLSISGALSVGSTLTTGGAITSGGDITTNHALTVGGTSTLASVSTTGMNTSGTTTTNKLVSLQDATINGVLWVGSSTDLRSSLNVVGAIRAQGDLQVDGLSKLGKATASEVTISGNAIVQGILSSNDLEVLGDVVVSGNSTVDGSSTVDRDLIVGGVANIVTSLTTPSASITTMTGEDISITGDFISGTIETGDIDYTGNLIGNNATLHYLNSQNITSSHVEANNLIVNGSATIPGLSGTNTGDEVEATPIVSGTVRITSNSPDPIVYTVGDAQAAFLRVAERGTTIATLVAGKVPIEQLPALAITETHVVASIEAMNSLNAQVGDVAILTNPASTYILQTEPNGWVMLNSPTDAVPSVFNRVGPIQAQVGDYTASMISLTPIPSLNAEDVQQGIGQLLNYMADHVGDTDNPHMVNAEQLGAIPSWEKGSGLGVATLNDVGKVPLEQLPSDLLLQSSSRKLQEFTVDDLLTGDILEVVHNLGEKYPSNITVYSNLGRTVIPDEVEVISTSTLRVYLTSYSNNMSGTWRVVVAL